MDTEAYACAVLREFLSRRNLKSTLYALEAEMSRSENSISSRTALIKGLGLEKVYKRNKEREQPLQTTLEMIIDNLLNQPKERDGHHNSEPLASSLTRSAPGQPTNHEPSAHTTQNLASTAPASRKASHPSSSPSQAFNPSASKPSGGNAAQPTSSNSQYQPEPASDMKKSNIAKVYKAVTETDDSHVPQRPSSSGKRRPKNEAPKSSSGVFEGNEKLLMEDFGDDDGHSHYHQPSGSKAPSSYPAQKRAPKGIPIPIDTAKQLRLLMFGRMGSFNEEWKQGFYFDNHQNIRYGLVQQKGGPCGVIASVQSFIILQLLYKMEKEPKASPLNPSDKHRRKALVEAMVDILWQIGDRRIGRLCMPGAKRDYEPAAEYKPDGYTEFAVVYDFLTQDDLRDYLADNVDQFMTPNGRGIIFFTYSAILSRGIFSLREDMDNPDGCLMGAHGYCTLELVNLLLHGRAHSNVFDGQLTIGDGGADKTILRGIQKPNAIGFLTLFEHYNSLKVGDYYKKPKYPIWVICSESHFTTLFALEPISDTQKRFELLYYDELAHQDDEYRLGIDLTHSQPVPHKDGDLTPPLDLCIRTKWPNARVTWIGCEPIL